MGENTDSINPNKETLSNPIQINKVHFLIHPGFCTDPRVIEDSEEGLLEYRNLLDRYIRNARIMGNDELMFAFVHSTRDELNSDLREGKPYIKTLLGLKKILGKRLIVLSDVFDIFNQPQAIETALEIAKKRGFVIDPSSVESVAYGETAGVCVPDGAENLNISGGFSNKTTIIPELTIPKDSIDAIQWAEKRIKQAIEMSDHSHLRVQEMEIPVK